MENFLKGKKVVVTGGSGFIGTHFLKELVNRGARVRTSTNKSLFMVVSTYYLLMIVLN